MKPAQIFNKVFVEYLSCEKCGLGLHRLASWAEERGWIYYRKKGGGSGALGNALLELQTFLEPSKRHILDERVQKNPAAQDSGDKPKAGI